MTRRTLQRGKNVPGSGDLRVRLATADDEIPLQSLLSLAGYKLEQAQLDTLRTNKLATAITAGLDAASAGNATPVAEGLMTGLAREASSGPEEVHHCLMATTLPLVAIDRNGAVVGASWSEPPERVIQALITELGTTGSDAMEIYLRGCIGVSRFSAVAVDPSVRGQGLGATLVRTTTKVLRQIGLRDIYGQIRESDQLERFYEQLGFAVLAPGQPLDLSAVFGVARGPVPAPGERLFHRSLSPIT